MPIRCVGEGCGRSCGLGDASVSGAKFIEGVAPDGAEGAGLKLRAKVSDEGAGAVICLEGGSNRNEGGKGRAGDTEAGEGSVVEGGRDGVLCEALEDGARHVVGATVVGGG